MTEINRRSGQAPEVNDAALYDRLLDLDVLTEWTLDRQRAHGADLDGYIKALGAFQKRLRAEVVPGDGRMSAARRARKVEKHLRTMIRASQKAQTAAEQLRLSYAAHTAHVQALPAQREAKQLRKAGRRDQLASLTAKSLHKSAAAFAPAVEETATAPADQTARPTARGITDLFNQQRRGA